LNDGYPEKRNVSLRVTLNPHTFIFGLSSVADDQFSDIISSDEAWTIVEPEIVAEGETNEAFEADYRPTMGARKVKALIEQVAGEIQLRSVCIVAHG
jgi:hypothetical protein